MKPDLSLYDKVIVAFSGGKDSLASLLYLLEEGVNRDRLELWHHDVDGGEQFMDWPCTESYCKAVAEALGTPIHFSWRKGGFLTEMLRDGHHTEPVQFESYDGKLRTVGGGGQLLTRMQYPQVGAIQSGRWCSAKLKIDVARAIFSNDERLAEGRFLLVTGERAEESKSRAKYPTSEEHTSTTCKRKVIQWRPVLHWKEKDVWRIIQDHRIRPHPAYYLGWGRVSCAFCIFGDKDQWASARALMPAGFRKVADYEKDFGKTIRQGISVERYADMGKVFLPEKGSIHERLALSRDYPLSMARLDRDEEWKLPAGAYKKAGGPT